MKITIDIDEEKITKHIEELVSEQIANQLAKELGAGRDSLSYRYHVEVRGIIRDIMKENYSKLAKEAVNAAAKSIENRAFKDKLMKILEE